jgi:glucose-6-phosphate 1-epimerase
MMSANASQDDFFANIIQLKSPDGGLVRISPYGAHVLSWVTADGDERLFLSKKAEYRMGAAIRGGVPVIFPQFSELGSLPKHGFARNQVWDVARVSADSAVLRLSDTETTRQLWPQRFAAEYTVHCAAGHLELTLAITNTDTVPFTFTAALHTYLRVKNAVEAGVLGLQGLIYRDSANAGRESHETSERVTFRGEVDRIYMDTPAALQLVDAGRNLSVRAAGFADAVIWNPGPEKCARLADMEADGYLQFVCMEAAAVARPVRLAPGTTWQGKQSLYVPRD